MKRSTTVLAALVVLTGMTSLLFAGQPGGEKPGGTPDREVLKQLREVKKGLRSKSAVEQGKAVNALVGVDSDSPQVLKELVTNLVLATNSLRGEDRRRCAAWLTALGRRHPDSGIPEKVKAVLRFIEQHERSNADIQVCLTLFDYLLEIGDGDVHKIIEGFLGLLKDYLKIFELLMKHSSEASLKIVTGIATDLKEKNLIKRRDAVTHLGAWWNGPPLYRIRIPALLKAMKSAATSSDAIAALKKICLPDFSRPDRWLRWWKTIEKKPEWNDLDIIREDFREAFERQRARTLRQEGASAIADWIRDWNNPSFQWAVPLLIDPLLTYDNEDIRNRVISVLGDIAASETLEPLGDILKECEGQDRAKRAMLADVIRNLAKIAEPLADAETREKTAKRLEPYLDSLFESVVGAAAEAMGRLKYKPSWEKLVEVMKSPAKTRAAMKAAEALGKMQAKESLDDMLKVFRKCLEKNQNMTLALNIVRALKLMNVRSSEVVSHLIQATGSEFESVAIESIEVLGLDWKEPKAVQPIRMFFEDEERSLAARMQALEAIASYPPEHAASILFLAIRLPKQTVIEKYRKAIRRGNRRLQHKLSEEVKAGTQFHNIAVKYFQKPGHILPEHRGELIDVAKGQDNNITARALCTRWLGKKEIWKEDECLDHVLNLLEATEVPVVDAAADVLKKNRSKNALEAIIKVLPAQSSGRNTWQNMQKADILNDYVFHSNKFNAEKPERSPNFGCNGRSWLNWWNKVSSSFEFIEE